MTFEITAEKVQRGPCFPVPITNHCMDLCCNLYWVTAFEIVISSELSLVVHYLTGYYIGGDGWSQPGLCSTQIYRADSTLTHVTIHVIQL